MDGQAHWLDLGVIAIGALLLLAVLLLTTVHRFFRRDRRQVECPHEHERENVTLIKDVRTGRYTTVDRCSKFAHPNDVSCDQECRTELNAGRPPLAASK